VQGASERAFAAWISRSWICYGRLGHCVYLGPPMGIDEAHSMAVGFDLVDGGVAPSTRNRRMNGEDC
jgi:hypothetical protein